MATLDAILSDDVRWHSTGKAPFSGDFEGKQAVFENWATIPTVVDSFRQDIHAIVADDEHAVAMVDLTITCGDRTHSGPQIIVFHVADGKATEGWSLPSIKRPTTRSGTEPDDPDLRREDARLG